mmetsp:Transcript_6876/g.19226  ORF Transcript_6876/g.19226 Transcript_6876/m.19226 type:complete len:235 (-) Transcript_6876:1928-2632(-)
MPVDPWMTYHGLSQVPGCTAVGPHKTQQVSSVPHRNLGQNILFLLQQGNGNMSVPTRTQYQNVVLLKQLLHHLVSPWEAIGILTHSNVDHIGFQYFSQCLDQFSRIFFSKLHKNISPWDQQRYIGTKNLWKMMVIQSSRLWEKLNCPSIFNPRPPISRPSSPGSICRIPWGKVLVNLLIVIKWIIWIARESGAVELLYAQAPQRLFDAVSGRPSSRGKILLHAIGQSCRRHRRW